MKNRMILTAVLLLGSGLLAGCAAPEQGHGPEVDLAAEAEAIRVRSAEWLAWSQMKDFAAIGENIYMADTATLFDGDYLVGPAAIRANQEKDAAETPDSIITWTTSKVEVAGSGDLAYERGSWSFDPDGAGEAAEEQGQYLTVWKKVDGAWRCAYDAGTTIKADEVAAAE